MTPPITHILVPLDFSNTSRSALRYAVLLALKFNAKLTVAHIVPSFSAFNYAFPGDTDDFDRKVFAEAQKQLRGEIPEAYRDRLRTQAIVKSGDVRDELLKIIQDEVVDLLVMGTHGRRSPQRFILGSTTESLLRQVSVPVLTVSGKSEVASDSPFEIPFRRIIYATDLGEANAAGLRYSVALARAFGAQLTTMHAMNLRDGVALEEADVHAVLMGRLHKALSREHHEGLSIATEVRKGVPHREILKFAEESNADLTVINLQSKGLLERAVLGSTAERVIRASSVPVLSIPLPA